jgi:hypothetical protein
MVPHTNRGNYHAMRGSPPVGLTYKRLGPESGLPNELRIPTYPEIEHTVHDFRGQDHGDRVRVMEAKTGFIVGTALNQYYSEM